MITTFIDRPFARVGRLLLVLAMAVTLLPLSPSGAWSAPATRTEDQKLKAPSADRQTNDWFGGYLSSYWDWTGGSSVAVDGDTMVVGAPQDDEAGSDLGAGYVFTRTGPGAAWTYVTKLLPGPCTSCSHAGAAVAIDGDTVVLGAPNSTGAVHVFHRDNGGAGVWGRVQTLTSSTTSGSDYFGQDVDVDGDTLVVGAFFDDNVCGSCGTVTVFTRAAGGPTDTFSQATQLHGTTANDDVWFGSSVALDAGTLAVGTLQSDDVAGNSGSVSVYTGAGASWTLQQRLKASDAASSDGFGTDVDLDGDRLVVGALLHEDAGFASTGAAYVFDRALGVWTESQILTAPDRANSDFFGESVSVSGDSIVVGALFDDETYNDEGSAHLFAFDGVSWGWVDKLGRSDMATQPSSHYFGRSVVVSGDTVAVGALLDDETASDSGAVYVYGVVVSGAPVITSIDSPGGTRYDENSSVTINVEFADAEPGETHTYSIDWDGDGLDAGQGDVIDEPVAPAIVGRAFTANHTYTDDGVSPGNGTAFDQFPIIVSVTDSAGQTGNGALPIRIDNVDPVLSNAAVDATVDENGTVEVTGDISDVGPDDAFTVTVDWGEGAPEDFAFPAGTTALSGVTHQYLDDDPTGTASDVYDITVTLTDDDTGSDSATLSTTVGNVSPTVTNLLVDGAASTVSSSVEGDTVTMTFDLGDPGTLDTFTVEIDWETDGVIDVTDTTATTGAQSYVSPAYPDDATPTITLTVTDDDTGSVTATHDHTVTNDVPDNLVLSAGDVTEGASTTLDGSFDDDGTLDVHTVSIDWGDGSPVQDEVLTVGDRTFSFDHLYVDDNPTATTFDPYTISVTVADDDGGSVGDTTGITVTNDAPAITNVLVDGLDDDPDPTTSVEDETVTLTFDIEDEGRADTFDVTINWGDGSADTVLAGVAADATDGITSMSLDHQYLDDMAPGGTGSGGGALYGITGAGGAASLLYTVDPSTGATTLIGDTGITHVAGMAWDPVGEKMYIHQNPSYASGVLYTIDLSTAAVTHVGPTGLQSPDLTFRADGQLFAWDEAGCGDCLMAVDKTTGSNTYAGPNSGTGRTGLGFAPDGRLWLKPSNSLREIVPGGSVLSSTSLSPSMGLQNMLTFAPDGVGYSAVRAGPSSDLYTVDVDAATVSYVGTMAASMSALEFAGSLPPSITITVTDDDTDEATEGHRHEVTNDAPNTLALSATDVTEDGTTTLTGSFADDGTVDVHTVTIDWGEGAPQVEVLGVGERTFEFTHQYLDDNPTGTDGDGYTIAVTVADDDGGSVDGDTPITVGNEAPHTVVVSATAIEENGTTTLSGTFADAGTEDVHTVDIDWDGDGVYDETIGGASSNGSPATAQNLETLDWSLAENVEIGPNSDDPADSTSTTVPHITINGTGDDTLDWYSFTVPAGPDVQVFIDIDHASDAGPGYFDSRIYLYDSVANAEGDVRLSSSDDDGCDLGSDCDEDYDSFIDDVLAPGTYYLRVTECCSVGDPVPDGADYQLHVSVPGHAIGVGDGVHPESIGGAFGADGRSFEATHQYLDDDADDSYTINVRVNDDDGAFGVGSTTVSVTNVAPVAALAAAGPINEGDTVWLDASGTTDVGTLDTHEFSWDLDGDGFYDLSTGDVATYNAWYPDSGVYTVTVRVTDDDGGVDTASIELTVDNVAPTADAGPDDATGPGNPRQLNGSGSSDPGNDIVAYDWDFTYDGVTFLVEASGVEVTYPANSAGRFTIALRVTDADGGTDIDTLTMTVSSGGGGGGTPPPPPPPANNAPVAEAGGPYAGETGASIAVSAAGSSDPDGDAITYAWDLDNDGAFDDATGVNATFTSATAGSFTISVKVTDSKSASAVDSATVTVSEPDPSQPDEANRVAGPAGTSRVETAVAVSQDSYPANGSADTVVIARQDVFADALAGTAFAAGKDGPLLLTQPPQFDTALHPATKAELQRVLGVGKTVYLLGGPNALSPELEGELTALGFNPVRLAGPSRVETAIEIADATTGSPSEVFIADGNTFQSAMIAGPAAHSVGGVVILTPGAASHPAVDDYLATHSSATTTTVGTAAGTAYPAAANAYAGSSDEETSTLIAGAYFPGASHVGAARVDVFADALAGGVHIARQGGGIVLTDSSTLTPVVQSYLEANAADLAVAYIYGGTAAMSDGVRDAILTAIS